MPRRRPSKEKDDMGKLGKTPQAATQDDIVFDSSTEMKKLTPPPALLRYTCTAVMTNVMSAHLDPLLTVLVTFLTFFPAATQDDIGFDSGKGSPPGHQALPLTVHRTLVVMGVLTVCIILSCACFGVYWRRRLRAQERAQEEALNAPPPSYYDVVTEPYEFEITVESGASPTHTDDSPPSPPGPAGPQDFVYTGTSQRPQSAVTPLSVQALLRGVRMSRLAAAETQRQEDEQYADNDDDEEPPPTYDSYMNYSVTPTRISDG
ncbi:uncharacterized protein LOC144915393 isoform X2 [Branchiostoma floridae x Branchiostoma belcheri]